MRESIRLGRIAGINIGLNYSVIVIVVILVFGLAFGRFPEVNPGFSTWAYIVAGIVSALLLLVSLLVHELAHAVVARRNGIEVSGITLWLLGGVAELRGEPRSAGADLRIAVVGPLASLAVGGVFAIAAVVASAATGPGLGVETLAYLAGINGILAVFNLVPAAPLDGGRVLRAFLWWRRGDRTAAAVIAARAGRVFGFVLIALGFVQFVVGVGFGGLWLILIGLFLVGAASSEEQQTRVNAALHGVRVGDVMTPDPVVADAARSVQNLIDEVVLTHRFSTYPLVEDGRLAGLVTLNRIRSTEPEERAALRLADIACPPDEVPTAHPDDPLTDLLPRMAGCTDGRAVVLGAGGQVVGLVSPSDISRAMQTSDFRGSRPYPPPRGADLTIPHDRRPWSS
ncbi:site-2 protease family protein [Actinomadura bangladeshensis]|uniref:Zinc metalloprotease n=1 Tax=Actinomadura bangladeshensis TaxID=453573 RepID=A0A6L9QQS7_9ACTN|nr:site-2 protease family protein [Actinomadura bangladeshensis]NEA27850.1 CBS domain-containing protein [Actinomadura bangladeshensis]